MKSIIVILIILILILINLNYELYTKEKDNDIHVYLISLTKNIDRRQNFNKYYKGSYEWFEAFDGYENKDTDLFKNWGCLPPDTHIGYKALQISNCKIFEDAIKNDYEWIVIFEDDAEPPNNFDNKLLEIMKKYTDSRIIYLDDRNIQGDGVIPGCCTSCILYHKSVFHLLANELNPEKSIYNKNYKNKTKKIVDDNDCLYDFYLANLIAEYKIKTSSEPIVVSGKFISSLK